MARPREFDKAEALDGLMEIFWRQGYEATSMADLTAHTGVGKQSLYDTFGDKKALFVAALEHYLDSVVKTLREQLEAPGSPRANIQRVLEHWAEHSRGPECIGCFVGNTSAGLGAQDAEIAAIVERGLTELERAFARTLRRAQREDEIDEVRDCSALAQTLVAVGQGLLLTSRVGPNAKRSRGILKTTMTLLS